MKLEVKIDEESKKFFSEFLIKLEEGLTRVLSQTIFWTGRK